jgi:hypothetical protein
MIFADFADNNMQTLLASARKEILRRLIRSQLWPAEPAATAH